MLTINSVKILHAVRSAITAIAELLVTIMMMMMMMMMVMVVVVVVSS